MRLSLKKGNQLNVIGVGELVYQSHTGEGIPPRQNGRHLPGERAWVARDLEDTLPVQSGGEGGDLASRARPRRIYYDEIRTKIWRVAQGAVNRSFEELDVYNAVQPGVQLRLFDRNTTCLHSQDLTRVVGQRNREEAAATEKIEHALRSITVDEDGFQEVSK